MRVACLLLFSLAAVSAPALAVDIDGHIQPDEWKGARHITDFRQVQPLSGKPGSLHTEAWILATPRAWRWPSAATSRLACRARISACSATSRTRWIGST
jgi:hypothetical protein